MVALVSWSLAWAGGLLLLWSGVLHARDGRATRAILAAQRLLPQVVHRPVALALGPGEIAVGMAVLAGPLAGVAGGRAGALVAAVTYVALSVYVARLMTSRPGVSCGCFGSDEPAVPSTLARAATLACAGVAAACLPAPSDPGESLVALGGAVVVALMLYVLPQVEDLLRH